MSTDGRTALLGGLGLLLLGLSGLLVSGRHAYDHVEGKRQTEIRRWIGVHVKKILLK